MSTVSSENFLSKLCFCVLGHGLEDKGKLLKKNLLKLSAENKKSGLPCVSRPTIYGWFDGADIRNTVSFQFLLLAVPSPASLDGASLEEDRKKVANQLRSFCKRQIPERQHSNIRGAQDGWIHLRGNDRFQSGALAAEMDAYVGTYRAVKVRSGVEAEDCLSVEFFTISRSGTALAVEWWFLVDGCQRERFEGAAYFMGEWLWMTLHSPRLGGRFRHVCFDGRHWGRRSEEIRGGLLLSTSPQAEPLPTATRVVCEPCLAIDLEHLTHVSPDKFAQTHGKRIIKFLFEDAKLNGRLDAPLSALTQSE